MVVRPGDVVVRWSDSRAELVPLLREGGIDTVLAPPAPPAFVAACREAGITVLPVDGVSFLDWAEMGRQDGVIALKDGQWPGVSRGASSNQDGETAGASRQPWVDANVHLVGCLKALYPARASLLGFTPPSDRLVAFESLELALIEARMAGGNHVLALEPRYRERLLAGDEKARTVWRLLGRTARWLRERQPLFGYPVLPAVTALVEPGGGSLEIANLLYRQGVSPALAGAAGPPPPDPARRPVVVAVGVTAPTPMIRTRILAHAAAGSTLMVDGQDWWQTGGLTVLRDEADRVTYAAGRGRIIAYKEPIANPSEFALDVIGVVTHPRRAVRLWNAPAVVPLATIAPPSEGKALLLLVNYGNRIDNGVLARIHGRFRTATILPLHASSAKLKATIRGAATEVFLSELGRAAVIVFS